jgi:Ca-activated chloride channel family protein
MVEFANPAYLLLLLAVPLLVVWQLRLKRRTLLHPVADLLPLAGRRARLVRWGGVALRALALSLAILAVAGPRIPDRRTPLFTEGIALMMVVDVSGSMAERDFDWNGHPVSRLDAVKKVFNLFVTGGADTPDGNSAKTAELTGRPADLVGVVTFATRPDTLCPLTLSHSVLLHLLEGEQPRSIPGESETNISDAVALALHRLKQAPPRRKVLVLLTDGDHNVTEPRSGWGPLQAGQIAESLKMPIYTIDAGSDSTAVREGGTPHSGDSASPAQSREKAVQTLKELARMTGGEYFSAHDTAGLVQACRRIDALERSDIRSFRYRRYREFFPCLALGGFACLALAIGLDLTLWRRIP